MGIGEWLGLIFVECFNVVGAILISIFLFLMLWKGDNYIEHNCISYFNYFLIAVIVLTILIPITMKSENGGGILMLLSIADLIIGYITVILISHHLGSGLTSYAYAHTLGYLLSPIGKTDILVVIVCGIMNVVAQLFIFILDVFIMPFIFIPLVQCIVWGVAGMITKDL